MVDIHCHILPATDDGSKSWDMTAEMCRIAIADGVTHIVATPHCNDEFAYDRNHCTEMMGELYELTGGRLTFSIGCDFHFSFENVRDALDGPQQFTIDGTNYLLVELSDFGITPAVKGHLEELAVLGIVPIITHPERNRHLLRRPEMVLDFVRQGCLVQVTANALTGFWGSGSKKMAESLLKQGAVHLIASDAHDPVRRTPVLSEARDVAAKVVGADIADALVARNPAAIVAGQLLPYQPILR